MSHLEDLVTLLQNAPDWGYAALGPAMSEPTALATLALIGSGQLELAARGVAWLSERQSSRGAVGISAAQDAPYWPTSMAVLAWHHAAVAGVKGDDLRGRAEQGVNWILTEHGESGENNPDVGHDCTLVAWAWVEGTHSWVEPTAMHILALKQRGLQAHARTREAVRLLDNRMLPTGGCNYGNVSVLGQQLRPHIQPTGIALSALAGEPGLELVDASVAWLAEQLPECPATASLAYGLMGLTAHHREVANPDELITQAAKRVLSEGRSPYKAALLLLASQKTENPLLAHLKLQTRKS
jgi:hypothetical protein